MGMKSKGGNSGQVGTVMKSQGHGRMGGDGKGHMRQTPEKLPHQNAGHKGGKLPATKIVNT